MIEEALQHYQDGNFPAAEALYRQMLEDEPDNPEVLFMLSLTRQQQNDLDEPLTLLEHALRVQPKNPTLHHALGAVHLRRRELGGAERAFHEAARLDPNFVEAQNGIAWVELARGRFAAAEHALKKALKSEPEHSPSLLNMGIALLEQGRHDDAIKHLQRVLDKDADNAAAHFQLGRAFMASDRAGFAAQCFRNALERSPAAVDALAGLAEALETAGQHDDAADAFRKLLNAQGERPEVLLGLARCNRALGDDAAAEGLFLRALKLEPGNEDTLLGLCRLLRDRGRYAEVVQRLGPVVQAERGGEDARRLLAEGLLESGRHRDALDVLKPLLAEGAGAASTRLLFARILLQTGETDAGDAQLERLLNEKEPLPDAVLLQARRRMEAGDHGEAEQMLRALRRRHDLDTRQRVRALELLGDVLHDAGRYQQAWEQYIGLPERVPEVVAIRAEQPLQMEPDGPAESAMTREVAWSWPPQPPGDGRPEPTFLFAWPGSGRERLLAALSAHPGLLVVNDAAQAQRVRRELVGHPRGAEPLNRLNQAEQLLRRRKYWKALRASRPEVADRAALDAMWLEASALPTIYRLFPNARVVILRRSPQDMVAAWLQAGHPALDEMARIYAGELEHLALCLDGVPLDYTELELESLESDPGEGLRALVADLGLTWDDAVERAWSSARPAQSMGAGEGRNYATWLAPAMEALGVTGDDGPASSG